MKKRIVMIPRSALLKQQCENAQSMQKKNRNAPTYHCWRQQHHDPLFFLQWKNYFLDAFQRVAKFSSILCTLDCLDLNCSRVRRQDSNFATLSFKSKICCKTKAIFFLCSLLLIFWVFYSIILFLTTRSNSSKFCKIKFDMCTKKYIRP